VERIDAGGRDAGVFAYTRAARTPTGLVHDQVGSWRASLAHRPWGWQDCRSVPRRRRDACGAELEAGQDGRDGPRLGDVAPDIDFAQ
jgi:hypothetical protein